MHTFTTEAVAGLGGPQWLAERRAGAIAAFEAMPLPTEKEEVWRYTPIDELDLAAYRPLSGEEEVGGAVPGEPVDPLIAAFVRGMRTDLGACAAVVVTRGGRVVAMDTGSLTGGAVVGGVDGAQAPRPGSVLEGGDALVRLNDAFMPDAVALDVPAGTRIERPVLVVHWSDGEESTGSPAPATFPRTVVRVGERAEASLVEVFAGAPGTTRALVVPVTELTVADQSHLRYVSLQVLGTGAWTIGRIAGTAGRDATLRTFSVGLGGRYDRLRTDAAVVGTGGATELRSAYLGTGSQVHDIRTLQDHDAPRTTSDLLCKGAVAGTSRSVYSGLIRVRHGAVRSEAMQTNHNLVLGEEAHADSVPNLDIAENDVRCSHASTIGPVDEDQRYYLESRGVPPGQAERLIVLGFFGDIVDRAPVPAVVPRLRREVNLRLADTLGIVAAGDGQVSDG